MPSKIEWTDETWNPSTGCDQISPGCDNCYAMTLAKRLKAMGNVRYQNDGDPETSGPGFGITFHEDLIDRPLRWKRPRRVFVNSMSDLFHVKILKAPRVDGLPFLAQVFATMVASPQHTYQILTKRPQIMRAIMADPMFRLDVNVALMSRGFEVMPGGISDPDFVWPKNMWFGVTIENDRYSFRADHLRATGAAVKFISAEPLLGPLPSLDLTGIDWVIVGGESGHGARPMHPDWARDLRDRCTSCLARVCDDCHGTGCGNVVDGERVYCGENGPCEDPCPVACSVCSGQGSRSTAFFMKQWGAWAPGGHPTHDSRYVDVEGRWCLPEARGQVMMHHGSKHENGRELDGFTWDEMP